MEHLSALDAGFLEDEDSDRHISLAVGGLSRESRRVPRFTQVLRTHLLDLNPPEWVEGGSELCSGSLATSTPLPTSTNSHEASRPGWHG